MKRDMDLIRMLLLKIEESDDPESISLSIEGYTNKQINYHLELLQDAHLINVMDTYDNNIQWIIQGLTWKGHEFVEAAKNKKIWEKAKEIVMEKFGSSVFDLILQTMLTLGRQQLGI